MTMESIIYMEKVRSSQASVSINSYIELSKTQFFLVSIVKTISFSQLNRKPNGICSQTGFSEFIA